MQKFKGFIKENFFLLVLVGFIFLNLAISFRLNIFRYRNFDMGKFDLGNMSQMVWNTLHGRFMYLTDYFGTNMPRWGMSHVDPILMLFLPIFAIFQSPLTLVFSQLILVIGSALLIYLIAKLELKSNLAAGLIGISFLFYPALGFINAWTGYHGVSVAIPFFLGAFYVFEKMYKAKNFTKKGLLLFWVLLVICMSGKEQIPLYVVMYGLFIILCRNDYAGEIKVSKANLRQFFSLKRVKLGVSMVVVGIAWFLTAFMVVIPANAHYRIVGYERFAKSLGIVNADTTDVALPNYFLSRYDAFGDSYAEVALNMILRPQLSIRAFFGGDKVENLQRTFGPLYYLPLASPLTAMMALPDMAINYLTTSEGIGTSEIENHRISMIIPVLFISSIYSISFFYTLVSKKSVKAGKTVLVLMSTLLLGFNIQASLSYNNPIYLWLDQAIRKRVFAKYDADIIDKNLEIGEVVKLSQLDNKDVECANKIVQIIPNDASVSGPDYLGAHLSLRETYAIFPALYNEADYVIVDVFSEKLSRILGLSSNIVKEVVEKMIKSPDYALQTGCGNLFVFKKVSNLQKSEQLPIQERFSYVEKYDYELFNQLTIVDYSLPKKVIRGEPTISEIVYVKRESTSFDGFVTYMTYVNKKTGEMYQAANLPSFAIMEPSGWNTGLYYIEQVDIAFPAYVDTGDYMAFISISNKVKTRNLYLGDIIVE